MAYRFGAATSLLTVVALLSGLGCASSGAAPASGGGAREEISAAAEPRAREETGTGSGEEIPGDSLQGLFRVRFRGVDGRGRVRLTLRRVGGDFALSAVDTFGRRLWSFQSVGGASLMLDHRAGEYCRLEGDVVVRAVALSDLEVSTLPRVLLGELPLMPADGVELPQEGEIEFHSADGRRWTARFSGGVAQTWTLWRQEEPLVWWRREADGGTLSHRDGAQALWKNVAVERDAAPLERLEIPGDYVATRCDDEDLS